MNVAVIVPVLEDTTALFALLTDLFRAPEPLEVHVVDAGEEPATAGITELFGATHHRCTRGRALQQNLGASVAKAPWLWFLHADTRVSEASIAALQDHAQVAEPSWGCFRHRIDHRSPVMRVIESGANLRARLGLPYGDQALFVHADLWRDSGGFPEEPFLEDVLLAKRLRQHSRPRVLGPPVESDARRWKRLGIARTTWCNWRILAMHLMGSRDTARMGALYRGQEPRKKPSEEPGQEA